MAKNFDMEFEVLELKLPNDKAPFDYYASTKTRPSMIGWRTVSGFIVPIDTCSVVAPRCVFYLDRDGLWHSVWVTGDPMDPRYNFPQPYEAVAKVLRTGAAENTYDPGLDYYGLIDRLQHTYGEDFRVPNMEVLYGMYGTTIKKWKWKAQLPMTMGML